MAASSADKRCSNKNFSRVQDKNCHSPHNNDSVQGAAQGDVHMSRMACLKASTVPAKLNSGSSVKVYNCTYTAP